VQHQVVGVVGDQRDVCGTLQALRLLHHSKQLALAERGKEQNSSSRTASSIKDSRATATVPGFGSKTADKLELVHHTQTRCI
jgi:hypothetical protein